MADGFKHRCQNVYSDIPGSVTRLARALEASYTGALKKQFWRGLALTMAGTHEGRATGFWGGVTWKHFDGSMESGDVVWSFD